MPAYFSRLACCRAAGALKHPYKGCFASQPADAKRVLPVYLSTGFLLPAAYRFIGRQSPALRVIVPLPLMDIFP
jgi:hypothetical protein